MIDSHENNHAAGACPRHLNGVRDDSGDIPFQYLARYFFEQNTNATKKVHEAILGLKNTVSSALRQISNHRKANGQNYVSALVRSGA